MPPQDQIPNKENGIYKEVRPKYDMGVTRSCPISPSAPLMNPIRKLQKVLGIIWRSPLYLGLCVVLSGCNLNLRRWIARRLLLLQKMEPPTRLLGCHSTSSIRYSRECRAVRNAIIIAAHSKFDGSSLAMVLSHSQMYGRLLEVLTGATLTTRNTSNELRPSDVSAAVSINSIDLNAPFETITLCAFRSKFVDEDHWFSLVLWPSTAIYRVSGESIRRSPSGLVISVCD